MALPLHMFRIDDYLQPAEMFHFARKDLETRPPRALHTHDFFELMLIERGRAIHRINGEETVLSAGDLVFIRPTDQHGLMADPDEGCRILNVMFRRETASFLRARYATEFAGRFFWRETPAPLTLRLAGAQFERAVNMTLSLRAAAPTRVRIEHYLLSAMTFVLDDVETIDRAAPGWLVAACQAARQPEVFRKGGTGFIDATGRGREHVCRQARRFLGATPTQYVNRIRIQHAAMLLGGTSMKLELIAEECGLRNMSHFHKLFREAYGAPPAQYRRRRRRDPVRAEP